MLSDHQDSEHFSYERTWDEIETMLDRAESVRNYWEMKLYECQSSDDRKQAIKCARNMKALEGVIKTLRWCLGDKNIDHPLN
jgi:hypothetical protein